MKKLIFTILCIVLTILSSFGQLHYEIPEQQQNSSSWTKNKVETQPTSSFDFSRLSYGGNLGLQFGDYTLINIAPQVGYRFSKYINAGAGFSYTYYYGNLYHPIGKLKQSSSYLGFNLYTHIYPISNIILMAQPEIGRMWLTQKASNGDKNRMEKMVPSFLIGGGLYFGNMTLMLKYDLAQDDYSPYGNNIFYSVGFSF